MAKVISECMFLGRRLLCLEKGTNHGPVAMELWLSQANLRIDIGDLRPLWQKWATPITKARISIYHSPHERDYLTQSTDVIYSENKYKSRKWLKT